MRTPGRRQVSQLSWSLTAIPSSYVLTNSPSQARPALLGWSSGGRHGAGFEAGWENQLDFTPLSQVCVSTAVATPAAIVLFKERVES